MDLYRGLVDFLLVAEIRRTKEQSSAVRSAVRSDCQYTTLWVWKPDFDSRIGHHVTDVRRAVDES